MNANQEAVDLQKFVEALEDLGVANIFTECGDIEEALLKSWKDEKLSPDWVRCLKCCGTCIAAEAEAEWEGRGREEDGYILISSQDAESFDDVGNLKHKLYLCYGAYRDASDEAQLAIARLAIKTFEAHGFTTEWEGTLATRFCLLPK